ncbi:hypothetical protein SDC9_173053 [bioreactor metagenome]|uniref:Uncharacterized protein n=1 Tax=bioreactor metagenome TaxID=1076179 RepID=A0A645GFE3_9ZZZZ
MDQQPECNDTAAEYFGTEFACIELDQAYDNEGHKYQMRDAVQQVAFCLLCRFVCHFKFCLLDSYRLQENRHEQIWRKNGFLNFCPALGSYII